MCFWPHICVCMVLALDGDFENSMGHNPTMPSPASPFFFDIWRTSSELVEGDENLGGDNSVVGADHADTVGSAMPTELGRG